MRTSSPFQLVMAHLFLILVGAATLYPVLWVVKLAVTPSQAFAAGANPFPAVFSLENFRELVTLSDPRSTFSLFGFEFHYWLFGKQLLNSIVVAAMTSTIGIVLSVTAGYAMSRWTFPGRDLSLRFLLITQMFPGVVVLIPLYLLLQKFHLLNSLLGLALVYSTTSVPFCAWNLKGYFDTLPRDLEEAAILDGADRWTTFYRVMLPLARPAIAVTALFSFMTAWNEYILAATLMSSERSYTLPVLLKSFVGSFNTSWGLFAAGAILVSIPVMTLFFFLQKHLVEGLTAGSVKG